MPGDAGIGFPRTILSDPEARKYTKAMAFHGYVGEPDGMSVIQKEFPDVRYDLPKVLFSAKRRNTTHANLEK